jgi:predicted transcriptional regulator
LIAKELIDNYGFSQVNAAKKLGTTQAAVSYYLSEKRGRKNVKQLENNPLVKSTVREIVDGIVAETISPDEFMSKICDACTSLRNDGII